MFIFLYGSYYWTISLQVSNKKVLREIASTKKLPLTIETAYISHAHYKKRLSGEFNSTEK